MIALRDTRSRSGGASSGAARRSTGTRAGRVATSRRRARSKRLRYRDALRVTAVVCVLTLAVMAYLGLLANVTKLSYDIERAHGDRVAMEGQLVRLDARISSLRSTDRLMGIAAKLRMRDASAYAVVLLPVQEPAAQPHGGYALLGAVTGLHR